MLFRHKIKVYVEVDAKCAPVLDNRGLVHFRYQKKADAAGYTTRPDVLEPIAGAEPIELEGSADVNPAPRAQKKPAAPAVMSTAAPDVIPPGTIVVYTDGGASPNPGPAGSGVLLLYGGHSLEIWEYLGRSTNNIAELTAILRALENIKNKNLPILLYSDSEYSIGVLTGRMRVKKNVDLIEQVQAEMAKCPHLQIMKVKAHVGIRHNEHVDRLVALARDTKQSGMRRDAVDTSTEKPT